MKKFLSIMILVTIVFMSCTTTTKNVNYSYPHDGYSNNASLAVKDYEPIGIIFLKSNEVVDGNGNHTGSKITYEMLMIEAAKLGADDVINIKIDVNQAEEKFSSNRIIITKTTYNYTATALAIKYTTAIAIESSSNKQQISNSMLIQKNEQRTRK